MARGKAPVRMQFEPLEAFQIRLLVYIAQCLEDLIHLTARSSR